MNCLNILYVITGKNNWEESDGLQTGVGAEYWFKSGEDEAYICNDQGYVTITLNGETVFEGYDDETDETEED